MIILTDMILSGMLEYIQLNSTLDARSNISSSDASQIKLVSLA